jgi:hypothetical protein
MIKICLLTITITLSLTAIVQAQPDDLGMFKGRKRSELPDNYREINTPAKLKAFMTSLEIVPKNAVKTKINGQTQYCLDRGGYDLMSGMKISDMRCWQK